MGSELDVYEPYTYTSIDGGLSWQEVAEGSHIYEIGDQGGLIVMAQDQKPTKEILFSWTMGMSWSNMEISDVPILVTNIVIES